MEENLSLTGDELVLFCEAITSFHTVMDMDEMLVAIFAKVRSIIAVQGISIALHDPRRKEFYFIRTVEEGKSRAETEHAYLRFPDDVGIAGWVMTNGRPAVIDDVSRDNRFYDGLDDEEEFITRSMICLPLRTRKGFQGVFYALNKECGNFSGRDEKILEIVAGTVAVALENARLYGEIRDHLQALEREKRLLLQQVREGAGFEEMIGSSPAMRQMYTLMEKILPTTSAVLIEGETGTGKELIARILHYNGPLREKPLVCENCGALPENLLESELFGHVRGAFTGAVADRKGLFEVADGGTVFLDEIGDMPSSMQVKLLRVLQEGEFRPVGAARPVRTKVRLIAATNKNLAREVEEGRFRRDLYYRINIFQITPPPLRRRKQDIVSLAGHFLRKHALRNGQDSPVLSPRALDLLMRYDWPGNVRELENEMERAQALAAGEKTIGAEHLSDRLRPAGGEREIAVEEEEYGRLKSAVRRLERQMITETLESFGGNQSRTAQDLGLSRQGLLNKIAAYAIQTK